ncbi:MAG: nuclear transport factor 2 family protein [Gammaproteobacteria bacterium]|nr:nuclear transport factor 2 family protein [Gammaproteobacteria bacterium]
MLNRSPVFILAFLLLLVVSSSARAQDSSAEDEVKKVAGTLFRAINEGNIDMVIGTYHRDSVYLSKNHPAARGIEEIKKAYQDTFGRVKFKVEHVFQQVFTDSSIAVIESSANGTITLQETQKTVPVDVKELFVFRKINNQWKIDRYMFNDNTQAR